MGIHGIRVALTGLFHLPVFLIEGWYLYIITTRWFGMRIDIISVTLLTAVVFASIPLSTGTHCHTLCVDMILYLPSAFVKV